MCPVKSRLFAVWLIDFFTAGDTSSQYFFKSSDVLFISTPILFLSLYGSYKFTEYNSSLSLPQYLLCYVVPLFIYAFYWIIVLNSNKTVSYNKRTNLNWSSKNWWWSLDGWEFEEEVARVFELNGYKTKVTKKSGDGGIDIIMYKNNYKYAVQCKHYQDEVHRKRSYYYR